jgi:hypothetical protein
MNHPQQPRSSQLNTPPKAPGERPPGRADGQGDAPQPHDTPRRGAQPEDLPQRGAAPDAGKTGDPVQERTERPIADVDRQVRPGDA